MHKKGFKLIFLVIFILMSSSKSVLAAKINSEKSGDACRKFVELLIQDDYRAFIELQYIDYDIMIDCRDAQEHDSENPVYLFGVAKTLELGRGITTRTRNALDKAVSLLRKAADAGYEPAIFQLFRYTIDSGNYEDPFLRTRKSLRYKIDDKAKFYVEKLKKSKSLRIRNFVLGYLVHDFSKPKLAVALLEQNLKHGSIKTKFYLGMMQSSGLGMIRDLKNGIAIVKEAALLGDQEAQVTYAHLIGSGAFSGNIVNNPKYIESYSLLIRAVNNDHEFAFALLDSYLRSLIGNQSISKKFWKNSHDFKMNLLSTISCELNIRFKKMSYYYNDIIHCDKN